MTFVEHRAGSFVPPAIIAPAYADPAAVLDLVLTRGPYPCLAGSAGYEGYGLDASPFFRSIWATDGEVVVPGVEPVFENPHFIAAARGIFGVEIVRPFVTLVNIVGPSKAGGPHVDVPTFRGITRRGSTPWLLSTMGRSGLFERWAVHVAGALTWFYDGIGGAYDYWPDGPGGSRQSVTPPFGNRMLMGDNDYMYHRIGAVGEVAHHADVVPYTKDATLEFDGGFGHVHDDGTRVASYPLAELRCSILWRGLVFPTDAEARAYDEHTDDLDLDRVVDVFLADLRDRHLPTARPDDPRTDPTWMATLNAAYPPPHHHTDS